MASKGYVSDRSLTRQAKKNVQVYGGIITTPAALPFKWKYQG